jgi:hypothetical protein
MATVTANKAKAGVAARTLHAGMNTAYSEYTGTATLAAGDIIQMVKVPKGAIVHDMVISTNILNAASTGSAAILTVGDGVDPNRYHDQISASALAVLVQGFDTTLGANHGYEYTAADTVDIVLEDLPGSSVSTAAPVFRMSLMYSVDDGSR